MKKGSPIDSHKLRVFCHNHGGAINVARTIGRNTQTIYTSIHNGRATDKLIKEIEAAYCLDDGYFSVTDKTTPVGEVVTYTEETKVSNQPKPKSIVDELLDEMQKTVAWPKTETPKTPDIPKISVGQSLPRTYGWREKTLAEMTGDDINRMVQSVVSGIMSTAVKELLGMTIEVKLKKDGGAYGW